MASGNWPVTAQKKTARTFCCSCREASDANYFRRRVRFRRSHHRNIYTIL